MTLTVKDAPENFPEIVSALKAIGRMKVKVGLPSSAGAERAILAIQEHGSPAAHIPARPVIRPALSSASVRAAMADAVRTGLEAAWKGDPSAARSGLEAAGKAGADGIRAYIDAGVPPPNSPITVSGGWIYHRKSKKSFYVSGKGFNLPLVHTGSLYASFGYEIEEE